MVGNRLPLDLQGFHSGFFAAFAAIPCPGRPSGRNIPMSISSFREIRVERPTTPCGGSGVVPRPVNAKDQNAPGKEKAPQLLPAVRGHVRQTLINLAEYQCRYAKLNCKSSKVQSATPSGGGTCDLLNTPLSFPRRFLSLPVWLWVRCPRLSPVGAIAPPLGSHAEAWPPWGGAKRP